MTFDIHIIGGGLAGSEAAWQLAEAGLRVRLSEMRGSGDMTPAHETDRLAEMVCSNSFRSDDAENNAVGLLHQEMRALGSLIMRAGDKHRVPAGSALAVDREAFAAEITTTIEQHPNVTVVRERIDALNTEVERLLSSHAFDVVVDSRITAQRTVWADTPYRDTGRSKARSMAS